MLRHMCEQCRWQRLALSKDPSRHLQHVCQHEAQPLEVNGWLWVYSRLVIGPFIIGHAQCTSLFRLLFVLFQALGKDGEQHWHTEEWPGDLDHRPPLGGWTANGPEHGSL